VRLAIVLSVLVLAACQSRTTPPPEDISSLDSARTEPADPPAGLEISFPRVAAAIRSGLASGRAVLLERGELSRERNGLTRLYDAETFAPLWVNVAGKPSLAARDAIAAMRSAAEDGLEVRDYSAAALEGTANGLDSTSAPDPTLVGRFDLALSTAFLRYVSDLHGGRIDPRRIGFKLDLPVDRHDVPAMVRTALAEGTIPYLVLTQRPPIIQYERVKGSLAQYRELADSVTEPVPAVTTAIKPGETWSGIAALTRRLRLLGDLDSTSAVPDSARDQGAVELAAPAGAGRHDGRLVEAVKRFQERHGLTADGVIGRATVAALNVPLAHRVAQLELTLERLRWIPDLSGERFILVNIPTFHLWAWDSLNAEGMPSLDMDVIVGQKALNTQTPVFAEQMRYVIFRPYWNVPPGILRSEVLPEIRKDSTYLARNDMEIVQGQGDDARPVEPSELNLELLARGQLRVRQRPGPRNSLGLVKFMFPNDENVYLHSTPAQELFNRTRRDFSHGCVRVERPVDLALWVLGDTVTWNRERIVATMREGKSTRVNLSRPLPVILFYTTAMVGSDGATMFFDDIYGHDEKLLQALHARNR
jgi:murein L,D-transpeptidase YcbB/YkuD